MINRPRNECTPLGEAAGALSDIYILVTDCVPAVDADPKLVEICEAVVKRILAARHKIHMPPSRYRHGWERKAWEEYLERAGGGA